MEELAASFNTGDGTLVKMDENNHELDLQIEKIIEKNEGLWKCKVWGETTATTKNI